LALQFYAATPHIEVFFGNCYGKKYLFIWLVGQDTFPHLATSEMSTWVRPWM